MTTTLDPASKPHSVRPSASQDHAPIQAGVQGGAVPAARGVRQAGTLFLMMGVLGLSAYFIPGNIAYHRVQLLVVVGLTLSVGGLTRTPLVARLTGYRSLLIAATGLATVAVSNADGLLTPVPIGIYFVIIFVWVGQWHPPGTALRFAPIGIAAYLLPFAAGAPRSPGEVPSVVIVIAASVMVGEILARQGRVSRRAQQEQAQALTALARASRTDDLTGLGNRRLGNQLLDALDIDDAVVILDLDHFKRVNDRFGHARGDLVLQEFGRFLTTYVRDQDTVARMGGEEFLIVLKGAGEAHGLQAAQRLIAAWHFQGPLATLSAGIAIHTPGQGQAATYAKADAALYRAKAEGRARVALAPQ